MDQTVIILWEQHFGEDPNSFWSLTVAARMLTVVVRFLVAVLSWSWGKELGNRVHQNAQNLSVLRELQLFFPNKYFFFFFTSLWLTSRDLKRLIWTKFVSVLITFIERQFFVLFCFGLVLVLFLQFLFQRWLSIIVSFLKTLSYIT